MQPSNTLIDVQLIQSKFFYRLNLVNADIAVPDREISEIREYETPEVNENEVVQRMPETLTFE